MPYEAVFFSKVPPKLGELVGGRFRATAKLRTGPYPLVAFTSLDESPDALSLDCRPGDPNCLTTAACVAARRNPAVDPATLRADAVAMGAPEIDGLAARWLVQDALLRGQVSPDRVACGADTVQARALDLENATLSGRDPAGFLAAAQVWRQLGDTVWLARALLWHAQSAGDPGPLAEARELLGRLGAPAYLEAAFRQQVAQVQLA